MSFYEQYKFKINMEVCSDMECESNKLESLKDVFRKAK